MKILDCHCASKFQDSEYGTGKRAHNYCSGGPGVQMPPLSGQKFGAHKGDGYRCTVCGEKKTRD